MVNQTSNFGLLSEIICYLEYLSLHEFPLQSLQQLLKRFQFGLIHTILSWVTLDGGDDPKRGGGGGGSKWFQAFTVS